MFYSILPYIGTMYNVKLKNFELLKYCLMKTIRSIVIGILGFLAFGLNTAYAGGYNYSARVVYGEAMQFPMPYITATLYESNDLDGKPIANTVTDKHGVFSFKNCEEGVNYTVKFSSTFVPVDVVNMEDAFLLLRYLMGRLELTPLQMLAADADGNNRVNFNDLFFILRNRFINDEDFKASDWIMPDWAFSSNNFKSASATAGLDGPITIVSRDDISSDLEPVIKDAKTVVHASKEFMYSEKNNILDLPLSFTENQTINGLSLNLAFNSDEVEIIGLNSIFDNAEYILNNNTFRLSYLEDYSQNIKANEAFINLKVRINNTDNLEAVLTALSEAQFVGEDGKLIQDVKLNMPKLKRSIADFSIGNAFPNPGNNEVNFALNQPWAETVLVKIYNLAGQQVKEINTSPRNNKITISTSDLPNGSYLCSVNIDANKEVKLISILH